MSSYDVCVFCHLELKKSRMYFEFFFFITNRQMNQKCNYDDLCDFSDLNTVGAAASLVGHQPFLVTRRLRSDDLLLFNQLSFNAYRLNFKVMGFL